MRCAAVQCQRQCAEPICSETTPRSGSGRCLDALRDHFSSTRRLENLNLTSRAPPRGEERHQKNKPPS